MRQVQVFAGSSHPELASLIVERLGTTAAPAVLKRFSNAEMAVDISVSVRNNDVFIIQSGSTAVNDHLMELMIMVNACKMASAKRITAILPYFPYNKQSKRKSRSAITAKLIANMLIVAGVDHIITMDLHSSQIQGFFSKPVDNLVAEPTIAKFIRETFEDYSRAVVVSKNAGGTKRVTSLADRLEIDFALINRERFNTEDTQTRLTLVGDVKGRTAFILDDIIDGTHSFIDAAAHLKLCEAKKVIIIATHGILSGNALDEIQKSSAVDQVIVTNSYPIPDWKSHECPKLKVIDISGVLAEAIRRTHNGESISYLFNAAI